MKFVFKRDFSSENIFSDWCFDATSNKLNEIVREVFIKYFDGVFSDGSAEVEAWINPYKDNDQVSLSVEIFIDGLAPFATAIVPIREVVIDAANSYINEKMEVDKAKSLSEQLKSMASEIDAMVDSG